MVRPENLDHDCTRALSLIDEQVDGELTPDSEQQLAAHLDRCERCRAELELSKAIRGELRSMPQFDTPERVVAAAKRRIRTRSSRIAAARMPGHVHRRVWAGLAAAAVVLCALAAVLVVPLPHRQVSKPSGAEIARATAEARLAFALIADATERAEHELRDSVLRDRILASAVRGVSKSFRLRSSGRPILDAQPTPNDERGGST